ncbi:MASE2 domain-containing protein [Enterobacter mori]
MHHIPINKKNFNNNESDRQELSRRKGLRFINQMRFLRTVGLTTLFFPLAYGLAEKSIELFWWMLLFLWVFFWPHLAWTIACRAAAPRHSELNNVKADGVVAGFWIGILELNPLIVLAVLVVAGVSFLGADGIKIFISGMLLLLISVLITAELFAVSINFMSAHTNFI